LRGLFFRAKHYFKGPDRANKNICDKFNLIHLSMSIRHSFALDENGYSAFGIEAKGCVNAAYAEVPVVWSGG
jgi:hypothetical protein